MTANSGCPRSGSVRAERARHTPSTSGSRCPTWSAPSPASERSRPRCFRPSPRPSCLPPSRDQRDQAGKAPAEPLRLRGRRLRSGNGGTRRRRTPGPTPRTPARIDRHRRADLLGNDGLRRRGHAVIRPMRSAGCRRTPSVDMQSASAARLLGGKPRDGAAHGGGCGNWDAGAQRRRARRSARASQRQHPSRKSRCRARSRRQI